MKTNPDVANFLSALTRLVGDTGNMRQVKEILNKLELTPNERHVFNALARDIEQERISQNNKLNQARRLSPTGRLF